MRCVRARVKAAVASRNALDLCDCTRSCAADGGADLRMQAQEQLERPALAARAAGPGRAVNFVTDEHCRSWLPDGALRLCGAAAHAAGAQSHSPGRADQTKPGWPCSAGSMCSSVRGRVVSVTALVLYG